MYKIFLDVTGLIDFNGWNLWASNFVKTNFTIIILYFQLFKFKQQTYLYCDIVSKQSTSMANVQLFLFT